MTNTTTTTQPTDCPATDAHGRECLYLARHDGLHRSVAGRWHTPCMDAREGAK